MIDAMSTWLWLVDCPPGGRALDASGGNGDLAEALAGHFSNVERLGAQQLAAARWPAHTFDCIALHDALARDARPAEFERLHELLKPSGLLVVTAPSSSARSVTRRLRRAGYHDIRRYCVATALDHPTTIIPAHARTIRAYHAFDASQGRTSLARRAAAFVGLHELLFPACLLLARA